MSEEEQLALLATDGMLVKRPILVDGDRVRVGFREKEWAELIYILLLFSLPSWLWMSVLAILLISAGFLLWRF